MMPLKRFCVRSRRAPEFAEARPRRVGIANRPTRLGFLAVRTITQHEPDAPIADFHNEPTLARS